MHHPFMRTDKIHETTSLLFVEALLTYSSQANDRLLNTKCTCFITF